MFQGYFKNCLLYSTKGQLIAFVGPDGSGKTTIIDKESEYLKPFFYFIKKYHMRFNIFPELKTGHGFSSMKGRVKVSKTDSNSKNLIINRLRKLIKYFGFMVCCYILYN